MLVTDCLSAYKGNVFNFLATEGSVNFFNSINL